MSKELTKEQLLEYVKKQKLKIKKLETDLAEAVAKSTTEHESKVPANHTVDDSKLAELQSEILSKDDEIEALSNDLHESEAKFMRAKNEYESKFTQWSKEKEILTTKLKDAEAAASRARELEDEADELRAKLQSVDIAKEQLVQMIQNLQKDYDDVMTQKNALELSEQQLMEANRTLQATVDSLSEASKSSDDQLQLVASDLKAQLEEMTRKNGELISASETERCNFDSRNKELSEQLSFKTDEISQLQGELLILKEKLLSIEKQSASNDIDSLESSNLITKLKIQVDDFAAENSRLMGLHESAVKDCEEKIGELMVANEKVSSLNLEITRLQEQIATLEENIKILEAEKLDSSEEDKLSSLVNDLRLQVDELSAENSRLLSMTEITQKEFDDKVKLIQESYEEQLSQKKSEYMRMMEENACLKEKLSHELQQTTTSAEHIQESHHRSSSGTEADEGMKILEDKLHRMKSQYQTSLQRIKDIEGQVTEHEELHVSLHKQLDTATAKIVELEEELAKERIIATEKLEEEQQKMRNIFAEHLDTAQNAAETLVQSLQQQLQTANASIDELTLQIKSFENENQRLLSEKKDLRDELVKKIESLTEELACKQDTNATVSEALASMGKQHESDMEAKELMHLAKLTEMEEKIALVENEKVAGLNKVEILTATIVELEATLAKLEKEKLSAYERQETMLTTIAALEAQVQSLQSELSEKEVFDSSLAVASASAAANVSELMEQLKKNQEELEIAKKEVQEKDDKVKKAILKLKQKMKENEEISQHLEVLKKEHVDLQAKLVLAEKEVQEYQVQLQVLRAEQDSIVRRTQESEGSKNDFEHRLKALNDALLNNEERLSAILLEKNKMRDEYMHLEKTMSSVQAQCDGLKQEKESQLCRIKELETREHDLVVRNNELQQLSEQLKASHGLLTNEVNNLRQTQMNLTETDQQLKQQLALSSKQTQLMAELQEKMEKERADFVSKEEALNERVKKLKGLLAKVNQASQEKDLKLNQLDFKRPKRFLVLAKVTVKVNVTSHQEEEENWTLILPDAPPSSAESETNGSMKKSHRWVEDSTVQDWLAQGSSIIGTTPENISEQWAQRFQSMQSSLERDRDNWKLQFEDISQQFNTYKVRAQTALKRIGTDDKERQRQKETEQREMDELRQAATTAQRELSEQLTLVKEQVEEIESLRATLSDAQEQIKHLEGDIEHVQEQLQALRGDNTAHQDTIVQLQSQLTHKDHELHRLQSAVEMLSREVEESRVMTNHVSIAEPVLTVEALTSSSSNTNLASSHPNKTESFQHETHSTHTSLLSPSQSKNEVDEMTSTIHSFQQHRPPALQTTHLLPPPPPTPSSNPSHVVSPTSPQHTNSKLLIHQQVDHLLRENIHSLREENSALNLELLDLRNEMTLRDDQIAVLKSAVRELEASLLREQEFNASSRHVNAEYLVNVLRKFLMAVDASERYKLVGVLCQMLHLQPEETRLINDRWAVRGGGLVGWLLPPKPAVSAAAPAHGGTGQDHNGGKRQPAPAPALDQYSGMGINLNPY